MIIAVGFKINNERHIQFIKWANIILQLKVGLWMMKDKKRNIPN